MLVVRIDDEYFERYCKDVSFDALMEENYIYTFCEDDEYNIFKLKW